MFAALALAAVLTRPDMQSCVERVLKAGGYGHLPLEAAAFVVQDGDAFTCEMWPRSVTYHSTSSLRRLPPNTVAIIHSHPANLPDPSWEDVELARRIGIPVLVVTPRAITAADPASGVNFLRKLTY